MNRGKFKDKNKTVAMELLKKAWQMAATFAY
jgi:hypothetical protein